MDVASFIVIGAIVSLIVQFLKTRYGTQSNMTLAMVVVISIVVGASYTLLKDTPVWQTIISILGFAGAVYTYILKRFEE